MQVECAGWCELGDGTVEPAVRVVRGKNPPLCVIPPFLKEWEGMIGCGSDDLQAVRASHLVDPEMTRHGNLHTSTDSTGYTVAQYPSARVEMLDRAKKAN